MLPNWMIHNCVYLQGTWWLLLPSSDMLVCEHVDTLRNVCIHMMKNKINLLKDSSVHTQSWKSWIWCMCFCDLQFPFSRLFYYVMHDWLNFLSTFILCVTFKASSHNTHPCKIYLHLTQYIKKMCNESESEWMHFYVERLFYISSSFKVIF